MSWGMQVMARISAIGGFVSGYTNRKTQGEGREDTKSRAKELHTPPEGRAGVMDIEELMRDYEAEVTVVIKTRYRTRATNYTGAYKLFQGGRCEEVQILDRKTKVENVREIEEATGVAETEP